MRFFTASMWALGVWAAVVLPASAGWDNVFQPTLFGRNPPPTSTSQYYVAPVVVAQSSPVVVAQSSPVVVAQSSPCDPCQQKACNTTYVQRSYYQPVTTYETKTVMEQVTTMRTSYYYEPVTTYRYSSYYDPCSCGYTQVAVPQTSYQLKAQSSPVQSWVSRCVQVPVQGVQKVDYWQAQTTCCTTTLGAPVLGAPPVGAPVQVAPPIRPTDSPPEISGSKPMSAPKTTMWEQYYPPLEKVPESKGITPGTSFQPQLGTPTPVPPAAPPVKFDRIAVGPNSTVEGQVVRNDKSPKPNAKVLFVNASNGQKKTITANSAGRFQTELPTGSWHVYLHGTDDQPIYHSRIDVSGAQFRQVSLVSRSN